MKGPITLLQESVAAFREKSELLLGIVAVSLIPYVISFFAIEVLGVPQDNIVLAFLGIAGAVLGIFAGIALVYALSGRQHTIGDAYKASMGVFWKYFLLSLMIGGITLLGFMLFIIPGIIVAVWFTFALYILLLEEKSPVEALKASRAYVRGKWWAVFGRLAALSLMAVAALFIVLIPATFIIGDAALEMLMSLLTLVITPIVVGYMYFMYKDVSNVQEEYTLESSPE